MARGDSARANYANKISGMSDASGSVSDLISYFGSNFNSSLGSTSSGNYLTTSDLAAYWYDYATTQDERSYNEWYYNTYESPSAMVQQYQDAGLNPALMYGSGDSTTSTNVSGGYDSNAPAGRAPSLSMTNAFEKTMSILGFLGQVASISSQVKLNKAQARDTNAQAARTEHDLKNEIAAESGEGASTKEQLNNQILQQKYWENQFNIDTKKYQAEMSGYQAAWLKDLYEQGINIQRLDAENKLEDVRAKEFQNDFNDFLRDNGYFKYKWHMFENELQQSDNAYKLGDPDSPLYWVNAALGFIGSIFGFNFSFGKKLK